MEFSFNECVFSMKLKDYLNNFLLFRFKKEWIWTEFCAENSILKKA